MTLPPKDPEHWLYRFSPEEWLQASRNELAAGASDQHDQRRSVATARRSAGMALNAVLALRPDDQWGRSYMDHLRALARDETVPETPREAARVLVDAPLEGPRLIRIGGSLDDGPRSAALALMQWCERVVATLTQPSPGFDA